MDIDAAFARFSSREQESILADLGQVVIRHGLDDVVGIRLLHKHHDILESEWMLETEEVDNRGIRCLTTTARRMEVGQRGSANTWMLVGEEAVALEFSKDQQVLGIEKSSRITEEFLSDFGNALDRYGVRDLLGPCIVSREYYDEAKPGDDFILVETTDDARRANVVSFEPDGIIPSERLIPAAWTVVKPPDASSSSEVWLGCRKVNCVTHTACVRDSSGNHSSRTHHSSQHQRT